MLPWQLLRVRGRSMTPTLPDGSLALLQRRATPVPGDVVVVGLPGGRPDAVKRAVRRDVDGWWVERDNPRDGVDSWIVGAIADHEVRGVVRLRLWPRPSRLRRRGGGGLPAV
jgi:SOS-response transcriptional repressor LexA